MVEIEVIKGGWGSGERWKEGYRRVESFAIESSFKGDFDGFSAGIGRLENNSSSLDIFHDRIIAKAKETLYWY